MPKTSLSVMLVTIVVLGGGVGAYVEYHRPDALPLVSTRPVTQGDIVETVLATGTLQGLRTVDVGAEVSGIISRLYVDVNSIVRRGQVIAQIDPRAMRDELAWSTAALEAATIDLTTRQDILGTDRIEAGRQDTLFANGLATPQERDQARLIVEEDDAQVAEAAEDVKTARSAVDTAQTDLAHCTIRSPIDGVVLSRPVEEGQGIVSRANAPTLFTLSTDLTRLEIVGDVDESDVARIRPGQLVTFTVEAYPATFHGRVTESRLNATTVNNVVTYQTIIAVANPDLHLLPGMTATFRIETSRVDHVRRVPNAALQFRPTRDILSSFGELPVAELDPVTPAPIVHPTEQPTRPSGHTSTIDTLLGAAPPRDTEAQAWILEERHLRRVPLRLGITDGTWTQLIDGDLHSNQDVITNALLPQSQR